MKKTMTRLTHKHFRLDGSKIKRAQRLLGTRTETETIERAIEAVITERERDRRISKAHERFVRSGILIEDVYGTLED